MDPVKEEAVSELLEIIRHAESEDGCQDNPKNLVESLPRMNPAFQSCGLRSALVDQLEEKLGPVVDEALASDELVISASAGVDPKAMDETVARLSASAPFVDIVDNALAGINRSGGVPTMSSASSADPRDALSSSNANLPPNAGEARTGNFLRRNVDALSSPDTDRESTHVKKKAARRDDWVGIFDLGGGGFGAGGFSPRVDIEAALVQLEAGLENLAGSATSVVEALGLLAEADPELFQFGNHWPPFLKLARRALNNSDPAVHAKSVTLHFVMYEKSMGMCAADMCEGLLAHARDYFSTTVHVLSAPSTNHGARTTNGEASGNSDRAPPNLMVVGDSKLAGAAREARALHGMLLTIHETFQHLPQRRVWSIVDSFFFLFGHTVDPLEEEAYGDHTDLQRVVGGVSIASDDVSGSGSGGGGGGLGIPLASQSSPLPPPPSGGGDSSCTVLLAAHFLAVAGRVDEWLPGWLRSLPTGRLVRAVNDAELLANMSRRCAMLGRIPLPGLYHSRTPGSGLPPEACPPRAKLVRHRLSLCAGSSAGSLPSSVGSAVPLGRALWLSAAELERSLHVQSVSFLGIIATHCRGALRPCPYSSSESEDGSEDWAPVAPGSDGVDRGLEQGKEVAQVLVQCARRRETHQTQFVRTNTSRSMGPQRWPVTGVGSASAPCVALGHVRRLADASAGGESTPFTPLVIDCLFSPAEGEPFDRGDRGVGAGEGVNGGDSDHSSMKTGGLVEDESPRFLGALAEIAGVLLSSRGASAGFFIEGPQGPRASRALLELVRCAAELARRACLHSGLAGPKAGSKVQDKHAGATESRSRPREEEEEQENSRRLAVDFACALSHIMDNPPKRRSAGLTTLWRSGLLHSLATLVEDLDPRGCSAAVQVVASRREAEDELENNHTPLATTTAGTSCGLDRHSVKQKGNLRDRLLLSLVEWARDLAGVNCLRRAGLAGPCASFLSRYIRRRHLDRSTREELSDARPLALALRLSMCAEGLSALLQTEDGVADGVDRGLRHLSESATLGELLHSRTVSLAPPFALDVRGTSGYHGGGGTADDEHAVLGGREARSPGLELCGDLGDLRCMEFVCRVSLIAAFCSDSDLADCESVAQMKRWQHWGLSRVVAFSGEASPDGGQEAKTDKDEGYVPEDVGVATLQLVTNLASDLTTAVAMEAEWSLSEILARRECGQEPADVCNDSEEDAGARDQAVAIAAPTEGVDSRLLSSGGDAGVDVADAVSVPNIVEPASLGRARLAVLLTSIGGPNEERHRLLRKLREAEALATSATVASGHGGPSAWAASDLQGISGAVEFPRNDLPDEEWWFAAGRCVLKVVTCLAGPPGARSTEGFELLRSSVRRRSLLWAEEEVKLLSPQRRGKNSGVSRGNQIEGDSARHESDSSDRNQAVMIKVCFSYARSLGFVSGEGKGDRERFGDGLKATLAAATEGTTAFADSQAPDQGCCCDWFAAVAYIASGMDSEAASEMLQDLRQHTRRVSFILPLARNRHVERGVALDAPDRDSVPREIFLPATSDTKETHHGNNTFSSFCRDPHLLVLTALVEEVLEEELPLLSTALRNSGWAAAPLAARWMRQSMLCVVDWPGVMAYLALTLLRGYDYQVYFVVALFRAAQPRVVEAASRGLDITPLLGWRGEALEGFQLEESLSFMEGLEERHRSHCFLVAERYLAQWEKEEWS